MECSFPKITVISYLVSKYIVA